MKMPRKIGLWQAAAILAAFVLVGEVVALVGRFHAARLAVKRLEREQREFRKASVAEPPPDPVVTHQLEAVLERWSAEEKRAEQAVLGDCPETEGPSKERWPDTAAAYFGISRFVTEMRDLARQHDVAVAPELWFGFADFRREAPAATDVDALSSDRAHLQALLAMLFEAEPAELKAVQREAVAAGNKTGGGRKKPGRDSFVTAPEWRTTLGQGLVGRAFRLVFTGDTTVLWRFVTTLSGPGSPWMVLSIDVRTMPGELRDPVEAPERWVEPRPCEFSVVVEAVERQEEATVVAKRT